MKRLLILIISLIILNFNVFSQNVGINSDGSNPDNSAMLDVKSTDKGMLIPRVVLTGTTDATTIVLPTISLLVYNTATVSDVTPGFYYWNGTAWTAIGGTATSTIYTVGLNEDLGGYVFYVTPDGKHGLVSETQDQIGCHWYNAQNVISNPANHSTAGKNFTDWRLPTRYELNLMYNQKNAIGGFLGILYWSSTEYDYGRAYYQNFNDGTQGDPNKTSVLSVRSVRAF